MAGQVAAPSANPSGGLAFGYTFTLTDNFTTAAQSIAASFLTLETASIASANKVSDSISAIKNSVKGLNDVTTDVTSLAKAFERLAKAKKSAGVSSSVETMKKQSTSSADSATKEAEKAAAQAEKQAKKQANEQESAQKAAEKAAKKVERAEKKAYEEAFAKELKKEKEEEKGIKAAKKLQEALDKKAQKSADSATKEAARAAEKATKEAAKQAKTQESERKAAEKAAGIAQRKTEREEAAAIKAAERVARQEATALRIADNKVKRESEALRIADNRAKRESDKQNKVNKNIEKAEDRIDTIQQSIGTMILGVSLFKPLIYAIEVSDEFERAHIRLKGLLGSDSVARSVLNNVKLDAKDDFLLNSKDLLNANANLISEGASIDIARKMSNDISTLVQVGGGTVVGYNNAMLGIGKMMGRGKIDARQANRLQNARIPMNHYAQEFLGKSMYGKGGRIEISMEEFHKVISMAAEKYQSVADEMKYTVTGLISMVSEGTTYIIAEFGKINSVIYKKLLKSLNLFLTKLMIFTQTPIGNIVIKVLSAALAFTALSVTILGAIGAVNAIVASLSPMIGIFLRTALVGLAVYKMLQSNSESFIALGIVLSTFLGRFGYMFAFVNLAWRAWQTFNDVTEESYGKMSSLNQMFARAGGYMEAFGEILSTINGDTYELSESLVMKLKSIGAFEGVLKMGSVLLKVYNALKKIYEVGSWVANLFDGWAGYAIAIGFFAYRAIMFIIAIRNAYLTLKVAIIAVTTTVRAFASTWALIANLQIATGSIIAKLGLITIAILALYGVWKLTTYLFDNWGSLNFVQKLMGVLGVLGLLTIAIYAIGTAFGIAAITEFAFLAPLLAILAVISALILGIAELYNYIKNPPPDISKAQKDKNIQEIGQRVPSFDGFMGSVIPRNFDNDMSTQRELNSQRYSPTYAPINQQNSDMSSSQDINLYLDLDGERVYQNQIKYHEREGARSERG